jgi:hypothetical protein
MLHDGHIKNGARLVARGIYLALDLLASVQILLTSPVAQLIEGALALGRIVMKFPLPVGLGAFGHITVLFISPIATSL